nr:MAG TPA: hypothetical protein [Microviridae sp.]
MEILYYIFVVLLWTLFTLFWFTCIYLAFKFLRVYYRILSALLARLKN